MKMYDNSRDGNDCWIDEKWYWLPESDVVVKVTRCSGWFGKDLDVKHYDTTECIDKLPDTVKGWLGF